MGRGGPKVRHWHRTTSPFSAAETQLLLNVSPTVSPGDDAPCTLGKPSLLYYLLPTPQCSTPAEVSCLASLFTLDADFSHNVSSADSLTCRTLFLFFCTQTHRKLIKYRSRTHRLFSANLSVPAQKVNSRHQPRKRTVNKWSVDHPYTPSALLPSPDV